MSNNIKYFIEKVLRSGILRVLEYLLRRPSSSICPSSMNSTLVPTFLPSKAHFVRHDDHCDPRARKILHDLGHLADHFRVERREWSSSKSMTSGSMASAP